jgi:light-dependent protochlorophyllide reductase
MPRSPVLALVGLLGMANGFKWMENIKVPSFQNLGDMIGSKSKFGEKKIVVITGTSSGMGKMAARALLRTGEWHVVGACRDLDKMEAVAEAEGFDMGSFTALELDLESYASVRKFCSELDKFKLDRPLDRLVCNAAVYQPSLDYAKWTVDGHEQQMQINFLSHFLLISKLMPGMAASTNSPRILMVGSVTGNDNTVGGGGVYPVADLKDLEGLKAGAKQVSTPVPQTQAPQNPTFRPIVSFRLSFHTKI